MSNLNSSFVTFAALYYLLSMCMSYLLNYILNFFRSGTGSYIIFVSLPRHLVSAWYTMSILNHLTLIVFPKYFLSHYLIWSLHQHYEIGEAKKYVISSIWHIRKLKSKVTQFVRDRDGTDNCIWRFDLIQGFPWLSTLRSYVKTGHCTLHHLISQIL